MGLGSAGLSKPLPWQHSLHLFQKIALLLSNNLRANNPLALN